MGNDKVIRVMNAAPQAEADPHNRLHKAEVMFHRPRPI